MFGNTPEFPITRDLVSGAYTFLYSQLFVTPPYPDNQFTGQTVIVTGSNVGLGLEAAKHFYRLNCGTLILGVRSFAKGQVAKEDIARSVKQRTDADSIQIWPLDVASTQSTLAFAERVHKEFSRVDVLVENAGIMNPDLVLVEGYEQTIQVNVLNTLLLLLLVLPKLKETKNQFPESTPHLVVVSSETYRQTTFPEINAPDLYTRLNEKEKFSQMPRYQVSKLMQILFIRELVSRLKTSAGDMQFPVVINMVHPGLCHSTLGRSGKIPWYINFIWWLIGRSTEVGGRVLVLAASAGEQSGGEYQTDGTNEKLESWIYSDVGRRAQKKVYDQTISILEARKPGISQSAGLNV